MAGKIKLPNSYRQMVQDAKRQRTADSFQNPLARMGYGTPNVMEGTQYPLTRLTRNYQLLNSLYRNHWIPQKIVDAKATDMVKGGWTITTQVEQRLIERLSPIEEIIKAQLQEGISWGRLYGGAGGIMMIAGHENILDQPLDIDSIMPGDFCGLLIKDRWAGIFPDGELVTDIKDPEFGLPKYYTVADQALGINIKVHHSRVIRFTGVRLPNWERQAEMYWGSSILEAVFDELKKRDNASWNIAQLMFLANLRVMKMGDFRQMMSVGNTQVQQDLYNTLQQQNWLASNMGIQILDKEDDFATHQYTFSGLPEAYDRFMMDIAGASGYPVTRLFGRSPAGMNATGESDENTYYDGVGTDQDAQLRPAINKLLPVMCMSEWGFVPDDLRFRFNPIQKPDASENADLTQKTVQSIIDTYNAGLINQRTGLQELRQLSTITGAFSNITDADIEAASTDTHQGEQPPDLGMFGGGLTPTE